MGAGVFPPHSRVTDNCSRMDTVDLRLSAIVEIKTTREILAFHWLPVQGQFRVVGYVFEPRDSAITMGHVGLARGEVGGVLCSKSGRFRTCGVKDSHSTMLDVWLRVMRAIVRAATMDTVVERYGRSVSLVWNRCRLSSDWRASHRHHDGSHSTDPASSSVSA